MNVTNLIDAIVRQTSVLLAQLATNGGGRAQLSNTANQVFLDLVEALREQGLGSRVIADMFGLALRTYQERVRRLSESRTIRGKSLWEAVLEHIQTQGPVLRADVLSRFRYDDGESVRGVLRDLVNASLVYRTGRGDGVSYRALENEHLSRLATESEESLFNVVHISVQQKGPLTRTELAVVTALADDVLGRALDVLTARGLIRVESATDEARYTSFGCVLPFDDPKGWEAAVFDHYQALVGALVAKLSLGARGANLRDVIGGSTYGFEIGVLLGALGLMLTSCGGKVDTGNTGSETHWLGSCKTSAECGADSCYCGFCTASCTDNAECQRANSSTAVCVSNSALSDGHVCVAATPNQVCASPDSIAPTVSSNPSPSASVMPPLENRKICDGSDDIRFVTQTGGGGPIPDVDRFVHAYGWNFLAIDGHCDFWASGEPGVVRVGHLDDAAPLQAYEASTFGTLQRFADFHPLGGCPDAGSTILWDPSGAAVNVCGIPEGTAPAGWEDAFIQANSLLETLADLGEPSRGPLRLVLDPDPRGSTIAIPWPLALELGPAVPPAPLTYTDYSDPHIGYLFPAGEDAETLRLERSSSIYQPALYLYPTSTDTSSQVASYIRDELPPRVRVALDLANVAAYHSKPTVVGTLCQANEGCQGLVCATPFDITTPTAANQCTTCVMPNDAEWACTEDVDCCGGLVCSVILDQPNRCVAPPDPCTANACDTCTGLADCWVAGCEWLANDGLCQAPQPIIETPESPCSVDATDPSLPGVTVHLESNRCSYRQGQGGEFRYTVESTEALGFTTTSSGGACGLCGSADVLDTWTQFMISGQEASYCETCAVGCCSPTEAVPAELVAQSINQLVTWPGLQWSGPSDTGNMPSGVFAVGDYTASVTVTIPGRGQVVAELPIHVITAKD